MKFKKILMLMSAVLVSVSVSAFELGKSNATIWHTKKSAEHAKVLQQYLGKVFGKKYTLKLYKKMRRSPAFLSASSSPTPN